MSAARQYEMTMMVQSVSMAPNMTDFGNTVPPASVLVEAAVRDTGQSVAFQAWAHEITVGDVVRVTIEKVEG